jgi:hypothetical protein
MKNIMNVAGREFQRIGEICSGSEFVEYYEMISD